MGARSGFRTALFSLLPAAVLLLAGEVAVRVWYGESVWSFAAEAVNARTQQERFIFREPLARPDPVVGYVCIPGIHRISLVKGSRRLDFRATIGEDGYRLTGPASASLDTRPGVWIFGCSFTWGLALNDEDTYPWMVQAALPRMRVRNLAVNGFGTVQALLQLRDAVARRQPLPKVAVVVYDDFHLPRNVAAPSFVAMMRAAGSAFGRPEAAVPAASLDADGNIALGWVPFFRPLAKGMAEPDRDYEVRVTNAILDEIHGICSDHGIVPVFAIQSRPDGDPVLARAQRAGFTTANLWIDLDANGGRQYRLLPIDSHPNRIAHAVWAERLIRTLRALVGT